ncbi:hypothetical protein [Caudoviricetes sp.]|nr:hypothetical protein [Caudoviricetes sp.]
MSFKITIECEDEAEALMYLNARSYYNLINDFSNHLRNCDKHDIDIKSIIELFKADFYSATEHHNGPY